MFNALLKGSEGNELAELYDMQNAGAIAFGDYKKALQNANLQKIAPINSLKITHRNQDLGGDLLSGLADWSGTGAWSLNLNSEQTIEELQLFLSDFSLFLCENCLAPYIL